MNNCRHMPLVAFGICCCLGFGAATSLWAQRGHKKVEEANQAFAEEKYDEANTKYRDALIEKPDSPILHYNLGDVAYKKRAFEEAMESYTKSLASDDILLQSKAYYNMGNTLYQIGKLPESILNYKKALELNPQDEDSKYNLEYVRAKLKDDAQKQNQQQEQKQQQEQQQQNQQQQQNDEQEQQEKEQQEKEEQKQQEQQEKEKSGENKEEQQQSGDEQDEQGEDEQEQPTPQETQEISKEDAERILNALQNEEQDLLKKQKRKKAGRAFKGKDW